MPYVPGKEDGEVDFKPGEYKKDFGFVKQEPTNRTNRAYTH